MMNLTAPVLYALLCTGQVDQYMPPPQQPLDNRLDNRMDTRNVPVVGRAEHRGYVLIGRRGRHYVMGGLAVADYTDANGRRHVTTLEEQQDSGALPDTDQFLYFRELATGNRWSIAKRAGSNGLYAVFFQPATDPRAVQAGQRPAWQAFHQADYAEDSIYGQNRGANVPVGGMAQTAPFGNPVPFDNRAATAPQFANPNYQGVTPGNNLRFVPPATATNVMMMDSAVQCCGR